MPINLAEALLFLCKLQKRGHDMRSHTAQRCHTISSRNGVSSTVHLSLPYYGLDSYNYIPVSDFNLCLFFCEEIQALFVHTFIACANLSCKVYKKIYSLWLLVTL
jgi:hypothetical protein